MIRIVLKLTGIAGGLGAALAIAALAVSGASARAQGDPYEKLKSYDFQDRTAVEAIRHEIDQAGGSAAADAKIEERLDALLSDPNANFAGKQEACRLLWIAGSARSVPVLASMLTDEKLSDNARYALERLKDPAASQALRAVLAANLPGGANASPHAAPAKLIVGVIDSEGDRGDGGAVRLVQRFTVSTDPLVAEAAIAALGKIGTPAALAALREVGGSGVPLGHATLRCAEHIASTGSKAAAERTYEQLALEPWPDVVRGEAIHALAESGSSRADAVSLAALKASDSYLQEVAARECGSQLGEAAAAKALALWPQLPLQTQIVLLTAVGDRHDAAALPIALSATESSEAQLRAAGMRTAAVVGGAKAAPRLIQILTTGESQDRDIAHACLADLRGAEAEPALLHAALEGPSDTRAALMSVLADRPSAPALAAIVTTLQGGDMKAAVEAARALARAGGMDQRDVVVKVVVTSGSSEVRDAARAAIVAIVQRAPDRESAAGPIYAAYNDASATGKAELLQAMAEIGGQSALQTLSQAVVSTDPAVAQAALTGLAETWSDTRALPVLLSAAKSSQAKDARVEAVRGYLRLVSQDDRAPAEQRVDEVGQALAVVERPDEKRQALGILRECRIVPSVEMSAKLLDDPEVFSDAADTVLYLAAPQRRNDRDLPAVTGPATTAALDKIIQNTKDDDQKARAQKLKGA